MIRKILKGVGLVVAALVVAAAVLYLFGLRVVLDGGGNPHLRFVESERTRLKRIAQSREAQRAQVAAPAPVPSPTFTPPPTAAQPGTRPVAPAPADPLARAAYWTDFRGPRRDGHYRERPIRTDWPREGLKPIWRQPIGGGYGSFAIARGRAFTIEQRGALEVVAAYDVATGRELWTTAWTAAFRELMGGDGPRSTPTWADGRVYALGGQGEFRCLDEATGRVVWRTNILENQFASTVLYEGFLYGLDESILACLDAATGELKWKGGRYGYGQVMLASGHLIVLGEQGDLALVRATPERHDEIARFPMLEGKTWNYPAMADGYLLIRNINEMAAFDLRTDRR